MDTADKKKKLYVSYALLKGGLVHLRDPWYQGSRHIIMDP